MKCSPAHGFVSICCCCLAAWAPLFSMAGCAPPAGGDIDGGASGEPVDAFIQINGDPNDPEVAILTGKVKGDKLVMFGDKDDAGDVTNLTSLSYFAASSDETAEFNLVLDEQGRPTILADASGEYARFEYDEANNVMVVTYESAAGAREVRTFDLSTNPDAAAKVFGHGKDSLAHARVRADLPSTTEVILVQVRLVEVPSDAPDDPSREIGLASDGIVTATASNSTNNIPPAGYSTADGNYQFAVASRVADIQFLVSDCESKVGTINNLTVAFQVIFAVFLALCAEATAGVCAFVGAKVATLSGIGATVGSDQLVKNANLTCQDLTRAAAEGGTGGVVLVIKAEVPRLDYASAQVVEYNLLDPADPITQSRIADVTFRIPVDDCGGCADDEVCDRGLCVQCITRANCADGRFCSEEQTCVECLTSDNCKTSDAGAVCVNNVCAGCSTDQQCLDAGLGRVCQNNTCLQCEVDQDCIDGFGEFACVDNECFLCATDAQCIDNGLGAACRDHDCVECLTNADCDPFEERCDLSIMQCVPDEGTTGDFTVFGYLNTGCDTMNPESTPGECGGLNGMAVDPALADVELADSPNRPTIRWNRVPDAVIVAVTTGTTTLYGIEGRTDPDEEGDTDQAPLLFNSVVYGSYNLPNIEPIDGPAGPLGPSNAVDLVPGQFYSISVFTIDGRQASITFQVNS